MRKATARVGKLSLVDFGWLAMEAAGAVCACAALHALMTR